MFCAKCGAELKEGAGFCAQCGAPVPQAETPAAVGAVPGAQAGTPAQGAPVQEIKKKGFKPPKWGLAAGAAVLVLAAVLGIGGALLFRNTGERGNTKTSESGENGDGSAASGSGEEAAPTDWREMTPLYTIEDVPVIDIYARNYTPAQKAPGIAWDMTLFYWLEDIDQESTQDGYLAQCAITKMLMRRADTGALVEYEIYRDPSDGTVYKVVSIEDMGDHMELADYYYQQGGVPNFTFTRQDSVYTPTYATPAKTGSRYYFNNDVLARWRIVNVPNEIAEYVLALGGASYPQADYYTESAELQALYDETESRELNAARNTYDAVAAAGDGIGRVEGRVTDTAGNPAAGMTVDIVRMEDGELLYRTTTGEDGSFRVFVYLEEAECEIIVREDETFSANSVQGVLLSKSNGGSNLGNVLVHRLDGDEYPVHIDVYSAADVRTGEDGSLLRELLPGAEVTLRAGAGAKTGEALQTLEADAEGRIETTLPAGTYTAQIDAAGYATVYVTVEVAEQETTAEGYLLPAVPEGQTGIVLTWEGEADLDLTLFTPYQSTGGDMAHIGGSIASDGNGNSLVADNASGCEVMYVNTAAAGSYKLYVNDYTESSAGNYAADTMEGLNIHIYIYDSTGLIAELVFPAGQTGVVWEAADLNGGRVTPGQRVYVSLEGKSWWTQSKEQMVLVKTTSYNSDGSQGNWVEYSYDAAGNLTREIGYDPDGSIDHRYEYNYDAAGNLTRKTWYRPGDIKWNWYEYSYDAAGNQTRYIEYLPDGIINDWIEWSYDAAGNQTRVTTYNTVGSIKYWTEYSYDAAGNKTGETHYDSDGSMSGWDEYSYDAAGNKTRVTHYGYTGSMSGWYEYSYDAAGNMTREIWCRSDGSIYHWYEYSYDEAGNMTRETCYNSDGSISIWYECTYAPLGAR